MIIADRQQFIDCVSGKLLRRNAQGEITQLGDAATRAVKAAERGDTVYLTHLGIVVSRIVDFQEIAGWVVS